MVGFLERGTGPLRQSSEMPVVGNGKPVRGRQKRLDQRRNGFRRELYEPRGFAYRKLRDFLLQGLAILKELL